MTTPNGLSVARILLYLLSLFCCVSGALAQNGSSAAAETPWCRPAPGYTTSFAMSGIETAFIPVSNERSEEFTGRRSFFNHNLSADVVPPTRELWDHYRRCFAVELDSVLFEGSSLFCFRLCRNGSRVFAAVQVVNSGRSYFFTVMEPDLPLGFSADRLAETLRNNRVFIMDYETAVDPAAVAAVVSTVRQSDAKLRVAFLPGTGTPAGRSVPRAKFYYEILASNGLSSNRADYGLPPKDTQGTASPNSTCRETTIPDRIALFFVE